MKIKRQIVAENRYLSHNWNNEKTIKYIIDIDGREYEAGLFYHYNDNVLVKVVIELPQSYGCMAACAFCAVSNIHDFYKLSVNELRGLFEYIYNKHQLQKENYVLVTMTGSGDFFFNDENVVEFLEQIAKEYSNTFVTVSSCLWNASLLSKMEKLSPNLRIRNIQLTYVTDEQKKLMELIPIYGNIQVNFDDILNYINESEKSYYRFNYVAIRNVNDDREKFKQFCNYMSPIRDKIVVRISMLNDTNASKRNGLSPSSLDKLRDFKSLLDHNKIKNYLFCSCKNDHMNCGQLITENG